MLSIIDTEEKLRAFLPIVDKMVQEGLVVLLMWTLSSTPIAPLRLAKTRGKP
jgi:PII-like signaling protein